MSELFFSSLNIIQPLVLITFLMALLYLDKNKVVNKLLIIILGCSLFSELMSVVFIVYKINYGFLYSMNIIIHNSLWIVILGYLLKSKKLTIYILLFYLGFAIANIIIFEGIGRFNNFTFILGAFMYLTVFIIASFKELKNENLLFFSSNNYLLLFSPVLFFFGFSFYFGFKDSNLGYKKIIGNLHLYNIIGYFVNIIYYTLINIYIYREKKLKHAR